MSLQGQRLLSVSPENDWSESLLPQSACQLQSQLQGSGAANICVGKRSTDWNLHVQACTVARPGNAL